MRIKRTILLVDADDHKRGLRTFMLQTHGFRVVGASDAVDALEILAVDARVDMLLTDYVLTRPGGEELARKAKEMYPALPVIIVCKLLSMQPDITNADRFLCGRLASPAEVLEAVRVLMRGRRGTRAKVAA